MKESLSTCKDLDADIKAIDTWAEIWNDKAKLTSYCGWHFTFYEDQVKADIKTMDSDWDAKNYFKAGDDLAALLLIEIGPLDGSPELIA